jgi:hypothetical protein
MQAPPEFLPRLAAALAPAGLNQLGVVARARYDAAAPPHVQAAGILPEAQSIVVVASGGRSLWEAFLRYLAEDPVARLARRAHPLDAYTEEVVQGLGPLLDGARVVYPFFGAPARISFMRLAELAGLGRPSELGILVGPRFGPWFGLRAALFVPFALEESAPIARLCDGCSAPCLRPEQPLARRRACVVAPEEAYGEEQAGYHYDRVRARAELCARFGVRDQAGVVY